MRVIEELRQEYPLKILLVVAQVARSVYYYHISHRDKKVKKHEGEKEEIKSIFLGHKGRYGYRRITIEMHNRGYDINHKTVRRQMEQQWTQESL